ncbi:hypothetical protein SAMN03159488_00652 [Pseudomonas sp. NFIX10]|nr:hypothetical protein SAMN03159488_00652 [Pseudomonas sp. NFIX10]SFE20352.1 hypothetical protein SAMN03159367_00651 [Pseudomonas sp. NFACC06-1]
MRDDPFSPLQPPRTAFRTEVHEELLVLRCLKIHVELLARCPGQALLRERKTGTPSQLDDDLNQRSVFKGNCHRLT